MNVGTAVVPGTTIAKVSAVRRLRAMPVRPTYPPLKVTWVKENLGKRNAWTDYNDGAPGAQPGRAPSLPRTLPDGRTRGVKFDGIQGDYVVDRKTSVTNWPSAKNQLLRQSQALKEANAIGLWEVPTEKMKKQAQNMMRKYGVTNIHIKVVKQ